MGRHAVSFLKRCGKWRDMADPFNRVLTLLSSSNSMTFSMTCSSFERPRVFLSLSKIFKIFLVLGYFFTLNS